MTKFDIAKKYKMTKLDIAKKYKTTKLDIAEKLIGESHLIDHLLDDDKKYRKAHVLLMQSISLSLIEISNDIKKINDLHQKSNTD